MTQWIGDTWRLKAGPQPDPANNNKLSEGSTTEGDPELRRHGYKESLSKNMMVLRCIITKVDISISARKSTLGLSMSIAWSSTRNVGISSSMRI